MKEERIVWLEKPAHPYVRERLTLVASRAGRPGKLRHFEGVMQNI